MTSAELQVRYPVIIFDRDPAVYLCEDLVALEALFEPAFEEEFSVGFDAFGRQIAVDFHNHLFRDVRLQTAQADIAALRQIVGQVSWLSRVSLTPAATAPEYVGLILQEIRRVGP